MNAFEARAYAAKSAKQPLEPFSISRRAVGDDDVLIDIEFCGVCHSDIHQARDEWGGATFPMVPGHEIVGLVAQAGKKVTKFKLGDRVGVGCFVDSCRVCDNCKDGVENYCDGHLSYTYNSTEKDKKTPTYGGYSTRVVVDQNYVLKVPKNLDAAGAAPLLCAGITTYSPLRHWKVGKGHKLAVVGLGGLGHMAVKFGESFGAEVTVLSTSRKKEADARRLGAEHFIATNEKDALKAHAKEFDFIVDTVSAPHDVGAMLDLLKRDGVMIVVGVPPEGTAIHAISLIGRRRSLVGSLIGGIKETQEMLDYCGDKGIVSDVEKIPAAKINEAYERMLKGDVRYRFVIDTKSLM